MDGNLTLGWKMKELGFYYSPFNIGDNDPFYFLW